MDELRKENEDEEVDEAAAVFLRRSEGVRE